MACINIGGDAAEPGCRPHEFVEVSARLINTLYAFVHSATDHPSAETRFLRLADTEELLLLSHSLGGSVAFSVLTGQCVHIACSGPRYGTHFWLASIPARINYIICICS